MIETVRLATLQCERPDFLANTDADERNTQCERIWRNFNVLLKKSSEIHLIKLQIWDTFVLKFTNFLWAKVLIYFGSILGDIGTKRPLFFTNRPVTLVQTLPKNYF
jgi:hypothetical protein